MYAIFTYIYPCIWPSFVGKYSSTMVRLLDVCSSKYGTASHENAYSHDNQHWSSHDNPIFFLENHLSYLLFTYHNYFPKKSICHITLYPAIEVCHVDIGVSSNKCQYIIIPNKHLRSSRDLRQRRGHHAGWHHFCARPPRRFRRPEKLNSFAWAHVVQ